MLNVVVYKSGLDITFYLNYANFMKRKTSVFVNPAMSYRDGEIPGG